MTNFLNRYSTLSALTHQAADYKPGRVHQNFQQLKMENSNMEAFLHFNINTETTLQMDTSKKGPRANLIQKGKDIPVTDTLITDTLNRVTPLDPEDDIHLPFRKTNMITTHNSTHILMSVQPQDSLSNQLDRLRKSTAHGNQLTRLSPYINTGFPCDKKCLPTDLHKCWNHRETLSTLSIISRTFIMMNTTMNTICMITTQCLMSENSSNSISNRLAQPEKNTSQKKYITRLKGYNNTDQLCNRESLPTDLPESWSHKEPLHNRYGLINHEDKIIPVTHKEFYILSRPSKLQPVADYITQYTHREKDLPQLPSTLEAQDTHREPATAVSQTLIASCKLWVDQHRTVIIPRVYRRTRTMLKIRCTNIRQTRHNYSQLTESEKAKFQTPSTSNEARNYVEHNSVEKISQDLVHPTKSDTASASLFSESEEREEIAADVPAPTPTLETVKEQSHTPGSRKSMRKNLGRPASSYSDFYM